MAAREGHRDEAYSLLEEADKIAPGIFGDMEADADLQSLHGDPRFVALVARAKERAAAAKVAN
jgi:hypothetical protein